MAQRKQILPAEQSHEVVSIDTLRPYPMNPRVGDEELIKRSLVLHGMYRNIVVTSDNVILAGNHTYAAMMALREDPAERWANLLFPGWTDRAPGEREQLPSPEEWRRRWSEISVGRVPILSTAPQAEEILAVDNGANDAARQDEGLLAQLLQSIQAQQGDLLASGYDDRGLEKLLAKLDGPDAPGEFQQVGHDIATNTTCPSCGFSWQQNPKETS